MKNRPVCKACQSKWPQRYTGLCVSCAKKLGVWESTKEREARQLARKNAREAEKLSAALKAEPVPIPSTSRVIKGVEYEVVFDGRQSLLGDYALKPQGFVVH